MTSKLLSTSLRLVVVFKERQDFQIMLQIKEMMKLIPVFSDKIIKPAYQRMSQL